MSDATPSTPPAAPPKPILAGRYRMLEQIGQGGMGSVWRAEHTSLKTPVAVKLLNPKLANDASLRARFLREAQSAAALQSVHIVRILDHGVDDDIPYIAMEYLHGESLRSRLHRGGALSQGAAARIFAGVCRGIARAHRAGIVHRDLKPDNIFITKDDELGEIAKVVDFGIAKLLDDAKLGDGDATEGLATQTGTVLGTPYYMSPEQLRGRKTIDGRSDLWSLSVIAFECMTGARPFVADAIGELVLTICSKPPPIPSEVATVPAGFDAWFARGVGVEPDDRYQTIHELAKALAGVLAPGDQWLPSEPEPTASSPGATSRKSVTSGIVPPGGGDKLSSGEMATATSAPVTGDSKVIKQALAKGDLDGGKAGTSSTGDKVPSATHSTHEITAGTALPKRSNVGLIVGAAAVLVAVGGGAYVFGGAGSQASPGTSATTAPAALPIPTATATTSAAGPAPTQPTVAVASASAEVDRTVTITFETTPPGAEVVRAGKKLGVALDPLTFDKGDQEITVSLRKPGFVTKEVKVIPDKTRSIQVELVRAARPSDALD